MCHHTNINIYSGMVIFFPETPMLPDMNLNAAFWTIRESKIATFWTMKNAKNATFWRLAQKLWMTLPEIGVNLPRFGEINSTPRRVIVRAPVAAKVQWHLERQKLHKKIKAGKP